MAGDWIKCEHTTPDKPEVVKLASLLGVDQDLVVGKLVRLWIWADQQSLDGNALSVTDSFIDRITFLSGFAIALRKVGWLEGRDGRFSIPNFDRHNGQSAKKRAQTSKRVAKSRGEDPKACNAKSVTPALPEKRREDTLVSLSSAREEQPFPEVNIPTLKEVTEYGAIHGKGPEECKAMFDWFEGENAWASRHGRLINWKHKLMSRKWETKNGNSNSSKQGNAAIDRNTGTANANAKLGAERLRELVRSSGQAGTGVSGDATGDEDFLP
jgi:hypothetical protein